MNPRYWGKKIDEPPVLRKKIFIFFLWPCCQRHSLDKPPVSWKKIRSSPGNLDPKIFGPPCRDLPWWCAAASARCASMPRASHSTQTHRNRQTDKEWAGGRPRLLFVKRQGWEFTLGKWGLPHGCLQNSERNISKQFYQDCWRAVWSVWVCGGRKLHVGVLYGWCARWRVSAMHTEASGEIYNCGQITFELSILEAAGNKLIQFGNTWKQQLTDNSKK